MKCPLLSISVTRDDRMEGYQEHDCLKEECAWWCKHTFSCAVPSIFTALHYNWETLQEIRDKMHHVGQLTK